MSNLKIATPISHLFSDPSFEKEVSDLSDALELRDKNPHKRKGMIVLYHSDLNICARWTSEQLTHLRKLAEVYDLQEVSFHILSRYQENRIIDNAFAGIGKPMTTEQMKANARENISKAKNIFTSARMLLENINHLGTDAYDTVTDPDFITSLLEENDAFLLLDIGHAKITCINRSLDFDAYLDSMPLDRVRQVHLSRIGLDTKGRAYDAHEEMQEDDFAEFTRIIPRLKSVEYVTIEYYGDKDRILSQLKKLNDLTRSIDASSASDVDIPPQVLESDQRSDVSIDMASAPPPGSAGLRLLDWDTGFFGYLVARIEDEELTEDKLDNYLKQACEKNVRCIYCFSDRISPLLENKGFKMADTKVEYSQDISGLKISGSYLEARQPDFGQIRSLARKAFQGLTRFYKDAHFDPDKADEMYIRWIDKMISDQDSTIIIIKNDDIILGFNGVSIKDGIGRIELIAVRKSQRGKGLGKRLIQDSLAYFAEHMVSTVMVGTQGDNSKSNALYAGMGFIRKSVGYWYHWWNDTLTKGPGMDIGSVRHEDAGKHDAGKHDAGN